MSRVLTDNSNFFIKVRLRNDNLPRKDIINVLDVFSGEGKIWDKIKKLNPLKTIIITRIDKRKNLPGIYLIGDNVKFLKTMDLSKYDVIDFDAYGFPEKQINSCSQKIPVGTVIFLTINQIVYGGKIPTLMLDEAGINQKIYKKIPTIFNIQKADKIIYNFLLHMGLNSVILYRIGGSKRYICGIKEKEVI